MNWRTALVAFTLILYIDASSGKQNNPLSTYRSLFGSNRECLFAEFMPVASTICSCVWISLFIVCPAGGRARSSFSLVEPWRILTPALICALVMVVLTGFNFSLTHGGLDAFCAAFAVKTNSTTCSSVQPFLPSEEHQLASWEFGSRAAATRAVSAALFVAWVCVAALLVARCVAAPDFAVRRTTAYLKDPKGKLKPRPVQKCEQSATNELNTYL